MMKHTALIDRVQIDRVVTDKALSDINPKVAVAKGVAVIVVSVAAVVADQKPRRAGLVLRVVSVRLVMIAHRVEGVPARRLRQPMRIVPGPTSHFVRNVPNGSISMKTKLSSMPKSSKQNSSRKLDLRVLQAQAAIVKQQSAIRRKVTTSPVAVAAVVAAGVVVAVVSRAHRPAQPRLRLQAMMN
jgi:hypothetical protein